VTQISAGRKSKDVPTNKDVPTSKDGPTSRGGPTNKEGPTTKDEPMNKNGRTARLEKVATNNVQQGSIALQTAILEK